MNRKSVGDYPLVILALLLSAYGIAVVYSAGQTDFPVAYVVGAWKRQLAWFGVSLVAAVAVYRASVRLVDWLTVPLYRAGIVLLATVQGIATLINGGMVEAERLDELVDAAVEQFLRGNRPD